MIVISRESKTQARDSFWTEIESQIESLAIVLIGHILHWITDCRPCAAAIANLSNVVQSQPVGNQSGGAHTHIVYRQDAAIVLKLKQKRTPHSCLHDCAVVISGVVKTNARMIAADLQV